MDLRSVLFGLLVLYLICPTFAWASGGQKSLGTFGVWQTYSYDEKDQPVCYMVKAAHIPSPPNKKFKRGPVFLMITHRPAENSNDVVSYTAGYNLKPGSDLRVSIGKNNFDLFTQKNSAWSRDTKTDHALAAAIRSSAIMKVTGVPMQNVSPITDTLDLRGAGDAYRAIGKACNLEPEVPPAPKKKVKKH